MRRVHVQCMRNVVLCCVPVDLQSAHVRMIARVGHVTEHVIRRTRVERAVTTANWVCSVDWTDTSSNANKSSWTVSERQSASRNCCGERPFRVAQSVLHMHVRIEY